MANQPHYQFVKGAQNRSACFFLIDVRTNKVLATETCTKTQPFPSRKFRELAEILQRHEDLHTLWEPL
jgi:hypothetical protein